MDEKYYTTPNGTIVGESTLRSKYGEKFDSFLSDGKINEVAETIYETPNGSLVQESVLKDKYGEKFNTFLSDGKLKKKEQTKPTRNAPLPGLGGVSEEPTPSPSVGQEQVKETTSGVGLDLSKITPQLIDLEEEEAISILEKNYSKLGFQFEKAGWGDAVRVKKNGKEEVFDFDPFTESTEVSEAARMKQWMTENSTQEDVRKQLRSRHSVVKQYEDPQELELNPEEEFTTEKAETLGFNIPTTDSYMGQVINLTDVEKNKALNSKIKDEKDKEAMKMAVGMEQGKVINQITGEGDAITPGQDMVMSQQVYDKIEAKKAKSSKSHWEGGENYYVNVMLNKLDATNPNKANDLRSRIENDDDFFNKEKSDLSSESAEVVREGLDIVLSVNQDNYVSASEKAFDTVNKIAGLEPQLEKHLERIDGKSYNGTPEQFQEYSELITQVNQLSDSQEMRELRRSIDSLDSTYRDYETSPDVNILDAYETIKGNYQRQVDAAYYNNSFVSDMLTPITDGVMRSGLGLVSNVTSLINNLNTDNKWGTTDDIAAWAKGAADTYDLRNPAPSKFSRDFYEEVAVVGDYEVELKGGKPTGRVFGSNGYLAQTDITENTLKQYNDDPDLYDKETNWNVRSGLYSSTEVGIDMVMGLMLPAGVFGKGFQAIGASEKLAATLGMSAAIVVQSQDEFVQMAKDAGANDQEALAFGMAQSAAIAGIAAINPIEAKALMRITGSTQKSLAKKYVQNIVGGMSRKDAAAEVTKSLFSRTISKIGTPGKAVLMEGGKEGLEEILEIPAGDIISSGWNIVGGVNTYTEKDIAEYINTFFLAGAGSLPFAFLGLSGDAKTNSKKELTYSATQNIDTVRKLFEENLGKKIKDASGKEVELTQEYIDEHIGQLEELGKMSEVYFSNKNLTEADKIAITNLLSRKRSFESKTTDDVSKNTFQSIINDINSSLNEYINKGSKTPFYVINGVAMSKDQVENRLSDEDFVAGLRNGRIDVRIKNDKEMQSRFNDVVKVEKDTAPAKQKYKDDRLSKLDELEEKKKKLAKEAGYGLSNEQLIVEDELYSLKYNILFDVGYGVATEEEMKSINDLRRDKELTSEQLDELLDKENKTKGDKKKIDELRNKWESIEENILDIESEVINRYKGQQAIKEDTVPAKQKGRLTKFSTPQDGIVGEVTYQDGTRKKLTQEEYDALEKQEGLFDVETGTQPVTDNPALKDVESTTKALEEPIGENKAGLYPNMARVNSLLNSYILGEKLLDKLDYIGEEHNKRMDEGVDYESSIAIYDKEHASKISEAYHKAKADGSNPELVKAVEQSLKEPPVAEKPQKAEPKTEEGKPKTEPVSAPTEVAEEAAIVEEKERGFFGKILDKLFKYKKIEEDVQITEEQKEQGIQEIYDQKVKRIEDNIKEYQEKGNTILENLYREELEILKSESPRQYLERDLEVLKGMPNYYSEKASKKDAVSYNKQLVQKSVDIIYQTEKLLGITATEQEVKERQDIIDSTPTRTELEAQQDTVPVAETPVAEKPKKEKAKEKQPVFGKNTFGEEQDKVSREITDKTGEKFNLVPYDSTGPKESISKTEDDSITLYIEDSNGNQIGMASFNKGKDGKYKANNVNIQKEYKRRGIGTKIYEYVEKLGVELRPSMDQTPEGKAFWESRKKPTQDAIQEQAAGKVPVQPEAKAGEKVEEGKPKAEAEKPTQEGKEVLSEEEVNKVADTTGTKLKNIRDLYNINRDMFGQDRVKSLASAIVMDRAIAVMAKRAGISKAEMYSRLEFRKAGDTIPDGVKFQVDAWHGSPYQFDKFTTEKIGTGEGAQAFGWGLYFTDLESIARNYAEKLSTQDASTEFLFNKEGEDILRYDLISNKDFKSKKKY
jgi:hypothetical protein